MHLGMLVIGGSETIAKGMTLLISLLSRFPDQREMLIEDPSLITHAFHEALRYDNPTQFLCRTVVRDLELHAEKLRAGQGVMLLYASGGAWRVAAISVPGNHSCRPDCATTTV